MPVLTIDKLAEALEQRAERLRKKEYKVTQEEKEVKEKLGMDPEAGLSDDAVDRLFADIDEIKKEITALKEAAVEEAEAGLESAEEEETELKFEHFGEYAAIVREKMLFNKDHEKLDALVKTTGYLEEGQGSMGGFTVPEYFLPQLLQIPLERAVMRPLAWVIPTTTKAISIPRIDDTDHSSNVYGGVVGYWTAEGGTLSESNPTFGEVNLAAKKLTMYCHISNELLDDNAVALGSVLQRIFGEAMAFFEDKGFIKGSGVNEPLGLKNAGCIDNIHTTASHFYIEDAAAMFSNMLPECYPRAADRGESGKFGEFVVYGCADNQARPGALDALRQADILYRALRSAGNID